MLEDQIGQHAEGDIAIHPANVVLVAHKLLYLHHQNTHYKNNPKLSLLLAQLKETLEIYLTPEIKNEYRLSSIDSLELNLEQLRRYYL